jgi:holo-[acyl-carrier protein] synthase|tara:strand:+ start:1155 stop:1544 length:390 start_codon:yes stop_codon:yes gene_type:complete
VIYGIGVDIAEISRFQISYDRFGDRLIQKILTLDEENFFMLSKNKPRFLAMRFAAKEATSKALGTGFKQGVAPRQIGVIHAKSGKPSLKVHGRTYDIFKKERIVNSHLSLSDDAGLAIAYVVLETEGLP